MGRRAILDPEKKAAAAAKVKKQMQEASKRRTEKREADRAATAAEQRAAKEASVAAQLREAPVLGTTRDQKLQATSAAGIGPIAREYYNPNSDLNAQLKKQLGNARTRISANPVHGMRLDGIADEIRGRLEYLGAPVSRRTAGDTEALVGQTERSNSTAVSRAHIMEAQEHIQKHQDAHGRGDYVGALKHLTLAADRINDAVNTAVRPSSTKFNRFGLPEDSGLSTKGETGAKYDIRNLFSNSWAPGESKDAWNEPGHETDLSGLHSQLTAIRNSYVEHLMSSPKVDQTHLKQAIKSDPDLAPRQYSSTTLSPSAQDVHDRVVPTLISSRAGATATKADAKQAIEQEVERITSENKQAGTGISSKDKGLFRRITKEDDTPGSYAAMAISLGGGVMSPERALRNYTSEVAKGKVKLPEGMKLGTKKAQAYLSMEKTPYEIKLEKERKLSTVPTEDELKNLSSRYANPEPESEQPAVQDMGDNLRPEAHSMGFVKEGRNNAFGAGTSGGR